MELYCVTLSERCWDMQDYFVEAASPEEAKQRVIDYRENGAEDETSTDVEEGDDYYRKDGDFSENYDTAGVTVTEG